MKVEEAKLYIERCLDDLKFYIRNKSEYGHEIATYPNNETVIQYKGVFRISDYDKCIKFKTVQKLISETLNNLLGVKNWEVKFGHGVEVWKW